MVKVLSYLYLAFGLVNLFNFVQSFIVELPGPFHFMFWDTNITGYRVKCLLFAMVFIYFFVAQRKRLGGTKNES